MRILNPRGGPRLVAAGGSALLAGADLMLIAFAGPASAAGGTSPTDPLYCSGLNDRK
jgi:hypothetical protein